LLLIIILLLVKSAIHFTRICKIAKSDYWRRHDRPSGNTRLTLDEISWNFIFGYFSKIYRESSTFIKIWRV